MKSIALYARYVVVLSCTLLLGSAGTSTLLSKGNSAKGSHDELADRPMIVYLIANPRAGLVEFLRMIGERGDFKVMHIPGNWAYCRVHDFTHLVDGWYREDAPATYAETKADILKWAEKGNVFVGENSHTAKDFLAYEEEFIKDQRVRLLFLISDPHSSIISYYKKKKAYFDELPVGQLVESMGLQYLYELSQKLKQSGCGAPLVIKTQDLHLKPNKTVQRICDYLQIPFIKESLSWENAESTFLDFTDFGWYTIELPGCSKHWHSSAIKSTRFSKLASYAVDKQGNPTFEEVENPQHRARCIDAYNKSISYYTLLSAEASTLKNSHR